MRLRYSCAILFLLALLLPAADALAHGGAYRGPSGGTRRPTDPAPGGLPAAGTPWPSTWGLNREHLLGLRQLQIERTFAATPKDGPHFLGRGAGGEEKDGESSKARDAVIDALLEATKSKNADIATGAVIALGKSKERRVVATLMKLAGNRDADKTVRESAALALGMLGTKDPDVLTFLADLAANPDQERRTRAFATLGLGFNGDIGAIPTLMTRAHAKEKNRDVPACAILALGLIGDEIVVPDLARSLSGRADRQTKDDILRAYNGAALALIRSRAALPALLKALSDKDLEVRRQAALALGAIAKPEDFAVIKRLSNVLQTDKNVAVKAFAAFALGEIGSESSVQTLMHAYRFGDGFVPHYCTLALALLGRNTKDTELKSRLTKFIRGELRRSGSNDMRGVLATAAGIIGDQEVAKDLLKIVDSGGDPTLRAHAVLSIGLLNYRPALPALRRILESRSSPVLVRETALTLGIMGDSEANRILIRLVKEGSSEYIRGSAAISLGRLATPETAKELVALLKDKKAKDMTRAFAAVALGLALDRDKVPMLSKLGDHLNHFMIVSALGEALTLL